MNLFGIGPLELGLILLLAVLIFGPKDLQKASRQLGRSLNRMIHSELWQAVQTTGRELKNLPNRLMRESNLDEVERSIRGTVEPEGHSPAAPAKTDQEG